MASSPSRAEVILAACGAAGDVSKLGNLLNAAAAAREEVPEPSLMLHAAASAGNVPSVRYLLARYPDVPTSQGLHIAAIDGGLEVYKAFLSKYPDLISYDCGHAGDPVALVAVKGDVPFLTFLLESGADANSSFFFYRPVCVWFPALFARVLFG